MAEMICYGNIGSHWSRAGLSPSMTAVLARKCHVPRQAHMQWECPANVKTKMEETHS